MMMFTGWEDDDCHEKAHFICFLLIVDWKNDRNDGFKGTWYSCIVLQVKLQQSQAKLLLPFSPFVLSLENKLTCKTLAMKSDVKTKLIS